MSVKKKKSFKIKEIGLKKDRIAKRCKQIEKEVVNEIFNPATILTSIATGLLSKYALPSGDEVSKRNSFLYNKVISKDKSGILGTFYSIASHPMVSRLFLKTKKSWIQWQLFNIGVLLVKKGIHYYKDRRYKKVEVLASEPLTHK